MEEFRKFNEGIEVSNEGNVKRNGVPVLPLKDKYYYYITYQGRNYRIHNLVGECFPEICGKKEPHTHLHHINENQLDNRAENLHYYSAAEHKRIHQIKDGVSFPVVAYDKEGNKVGEFASSTEASIKLNCDYRHVSDIVHHRGTRYTHKGYYFFAKSEEPEDVLAAITAIKVTKSENYRNSGRRKMNDVKKNEKKV